MKLISSERADFGNEKGWVITAECDHPQYNPENKESLIPERTKFVYSIPDSAIVWRQAELKTNDLSVVLDVLLTENLIPEKNPPTSAEHISRCAKKKLEIRLSTRSNKSVLRMRAADPKDPLTATEAEAEHPLDMIHGHVREKQNHDGEVAHAASLLRKMGDPKGSAK